MGRDIEKYRAYQKAWREKNKEKIKKQVSEYGKKWFQANKERLREVRKRWREENPEKARAYSLKSYYKHKEKNNKRVVKRNEKYPEKRKAVIDVMHAIQSGKLENPKICPKCNKDIYRVEAHHEDYNKPLEIDWLCTKCHRARHQELKQQK